MSSWCTVFECSSGEPNVCINAEKRFQELPATTSLPGRHATCMFLPSDTLPYIYMELLTSWTLSAEFEE